MALDNSLAHLLHFLGIAVLRRRHSDGQQLVQAEWRRYVLHDRLPCRHFGVVDEGQVQLEMLVDEGLLVS